MLIAADGAAEHMVVNRVVPHAVVGDFDSLSVEALQKLEELSVELMKSSNQETTDFEKCLEYCTQKGCESVLVLGFDGGEIDHLLGNWSAVHSFGSRLRIAVETRQQRMTFGKGALSLTIPVRSTVSIIPHHTAKVSSKGLVWELSNMQLSLGGRIGTRNKAKEEHVLIEISDGSATVVYDIAGTHSWQ